MEAKTKGDILSSQFTYLNEEQRHAVEVLCGDTKLGVLVGRAGTGKTTGVLKAVVALHHAQQYPVIGLSLSADAAQNLRAEAHCDSETLAFYLDKWDRLETTLEKYWSLHPSHEHPVLVKQLDKLLGYGLTKQHLVIVDEAGMIGTSQWHRLLHHVQKAGAKLIAVGDDHQFKAIDAGDFFRKALEIANTSGNLCVLKNIMRQKEPWMREASFAFAELKTYEALASYENHGCLQKIASGEEGIYFIAKSYVDKQWANPEQTGLLLATTHVQCDALNQAVRTLLKEKGLLGKEDFYVNHRAFSIKDNIVFLENDRQGLIKIQGANTPLEKPFFIKNGTKGKIVDIQPFNEKSGSYEITVALDDNTQAKFNTRDYTNIRPAYATTLYKVQGKTADWSYILASKHMDAYATYMALTRHKSETKLFYEEGVFKDFKALQMSLGRLSHKDLAIDYTIAPEHQTLWENVQEYKLLGQDLAATLKEKNWSGYQALKVERMALGKIILQEWTEHQPFMRQAGITEESVAIACELKVRPLSLAEIEAKQNVNLYAEKASQARLLWQDIRKTHPGRNCYEHVQYAEFTTLRQERNALAILMVEQKPLYREFVTYLGRTQGVGWKTLEAQAKQGVEFKTQPDIHPSNHLEKSIHSSSPGVVYKQRFERIEPQRVKGELQQSISLLTQTLLGTPQQKNAREWRYGNKGSISVCVSGTKQGLYANFESACYGGPLKLIQDQLNLDHKEAYKWAIGWLGYAREIIHEVPRVETNSKPPRQEREWFPIYPIPGHQRDPNLKLEKQLSYALTKQNRVEVERYVYRDAGGNLLGYTVRLENAQGEKVVLPLTYCQDEKGIQQWRWKGFGSDRPLYGLDRLAEHPSKPVLVVEGERTANSAQSLFPDKVVVSWPGGSGAVNQVDWSPLIGKAITLWPDNDAAGHTAIEKVEAQLHKLHVEKATILQLKTVVLPLGTPQKWDLADPLPAGWSIETLHKLLNAESITHQATIVAVQKERIVEVLSAVGMSWLYYESPLCVIERTHYLYEESLHLHQFLKLDLSPEKIRTIEEKSIIAGSTHAWVQKRFFDKEPYWTGFTKASDVALIAAEIKMRNPSSVRNESHLIIEAHRIFETEKENFEQHYLEKFKENITEDTLKMLAQEQLRCHHQTKTVFKSQQVKDILKNIQETQMQVAVLKTEDSTSSHKLEMNAIVHETLKAFQKVENSSIQISLKEVTARMVEQQNHDLEKSKELSKMKEMTLEKEKETSL